MSSSVRTMGLMTMVMYALRVRIAMHWVKHDWSWGLLVALPLLAMLTGARLAFDLVRGAPGI